MKRVWKITLYEVKGGYKAVLEGEGGYSEGKGRTPHEAYSLAESKLTLKPWLVSEGPTREEQRAKNTSTMPMVRITLPVVRFASNK